MKNIKYLSLLALSLLLFGCNGTPSTSQNSLPNTSSEEETSLTLEETTTSENKDITEVTTSENQTSSEDTTSSENQTSSEESDGYVNLIVNFTDSTNNGYTFDQVEFTIDLNGTYVDDAVKIPENENYLYDISSQLFYFELEILSGTNVLCDTVSSFNGSTWAPLYYADGSFDTTTEDITININAIEAPSVEEEKPDDTETLVTYTIEFIDPSDIYTRSDLNSLALKRYSDNQIYRVGETCPATEEYYLDYYSYDFNFKVTVKCGTNEVATATSSLNGAGEYSIMLRFTATGGDINVVVEVI